MKKCKKTILSVVMILTIIFASTIPFTASALLSETYDGGAYTLTYDLNLSGVSITGYTGTLPSDFTIPDKIKNLKVTEISSEAFANDEEGCGVKNLTIPGTVKKICDFAFAFDDSLETLTLNEGTTTIEAGSFLFSSIKTITIPASVVTLDGAFAMCQSLESITLQPGNNAFTIFDGALCTADLKKLVIYPAAVSRDSFVFPNTVTEMAYAAFSGAQISFITLSPVLTEIPDCAFYGNNLLKGINIPSTVTSIGERAFQCNNLVCVSIESTNVSILSNYTFVTAVSGFTIRGYLGSTAESFAKNVIKVNFEKIQNESKDLTTPVKVSDFANNFVAGGSTVATDFSGNRLTDTQYIGSGATARVYDKYGSLAAIISVNLQNDLNGDGLQSEDDYNAIINDAMKISALPGGESFRASADLNGDGVIDLFDASLYDLYLNSNN